MEKMLAQLDRAITKMENLFNLTADEEIGRKVYLEKIAISKAALEIARNKFKTGENLLNGVLTDFRNMNDEFKSKFVHSIHQRYTRIIADIVAVIGKLQLTSYEKGFIVKPIVGKELLKAFQTEIGDKFKKISTENAATFIEDINQVDLLMGMYEALFEY